MLYVWLAEAWHPPRHYLAAGDVPAITEDSWKAKRFETHAECLRACNATTGLPSMHPVEHGFQAATNPGT